MDTSSKCSNDDMPPTSAINVLVRMLASVSSSTSFEMAKHLVLGRRFGIASTILRVSGIKIHFTLLLEKNSSNISLVRARQVKNR